MTVDGHEDEISRAPSISVDGLGSLVSPFFQARIVADRHYRQGIEHEARGHWERALQSFRTACDLHPQRLLYLVARGRVCQAHGLDNEAVACYALARKASPSDPVALFNEADLFARRGDVVGAISNLRALLKQEVPTPRAQVGAAWRLLGDLELARRDHDAAILAYRQGVEFLPHDPYLSAMAHAPQRLRDVASSNHTAPGLDGTGLAMPAKASTYACAGAMLFGLPDDDSIDVPTYPGIGFISIDEVADALVRPLALFRRRRVPFTGVHAVEENAQPVAAAFAVALGIPLSVNPLGPRLAVSLVGAVPGSLRRDGLNQADWALSLGLRHPAWHYDGTLDGALVAAEVEVPWASGDERARRPEGDATAALAHALCKIDLDQAIVDRHLEWHHGHRHLRAGDPSETYRS